MKELTILMPCLNEARTLGLCIRRARQLLTSHRIDGEILVSDNGSTDGCQRIARKLKARVVSCPARGYGAALQFGVERARGKFILMGDCDDSYHFDEAFPMIHQLRKGADLCMGTRLGGTIVPGAMPFLHRVLGNPVITWLGRIFYDIEQTDFYCGMRAFRADSVRRLQLVTTGMEWALEMLIKSRLSGYRITEVPITLYKDGRERAPHLRTWRDGWRSLRFMLLHAPDFLFVLPAATMIVIGLAGMVLLTPAPLRFGSVTFNLHSLLTFAFLVLIGVQVFFAGLFAKVYSFAHGILPGRSGLVEFLERISLESLLILSLILFLTGAAGFIWTLQTWVATGFASLDYDITMRRLIPSLTLVGVAVVTAFNGFVLSLLHVPTRDQPRNLRSR